MRSERISINDLTSKLAVVTGVAGNLGPVWIKGLVDAGAVVVGICKPGTEIKALHDLNGLKIELLIADVCDPAGLAKSVDEIIRNYGVPHVLIANAGVDLPPIPAEAGITTDGSRSLQMVSHMIEVNLIGTLQTLEAFGPHMIQKKRGSIILIGSIYAEVSPDPTLYNHLDPPFVKHSAYGASKAGVVSLGKQFAFKWAPFSVRVNTLSPGGVLGNQDPEFIRKYSQRVPLGRMAVREDLIGPLLFLASDASSYVTGHNLIVDGGYTLW